MRSAPPYDSWVEYHEMLFRDGSAKLLKHPRSSLSDERAVAEKNETQHDQEHSTKKAFGRSEPSFRAATPTGSSPTRSRSGFSSSLPTTTEGNEAMKHKNFRKARKTVDVTVGESVRILRELQELSQTQLSARTGI